MQLLAWLTLIPQKPRKMEMVYNKTRLLVISGAKVATLAVRKRPFDPHACLHAMPIDCLVTSTSPSLDVAVWTSVEQVAHYSYMMVCILHRCHVQHSM